MDLSNLTGAGAPKEEQKPVIEYTAQTASPLVKGEAKLVITDKALTVKGLFDVAEIPFAEINALSLEDFTVIVKTDSGNFLFSRMGNWCQPFHDALLDAYNNAVLRSLFVKESPLVTAKGDYSYTEAGASAAGSAPVHVYENSVVALPPDLGARRVPLCFTDGMDKGEFELTLKLDTGESYTWARLGYDTVPFADAVEKQIRAQREKTLAAVMEIDPTLGMAQASQLARVVPRGAAAAFGTLAGIAPSFAAALEAKIAATRAAGTYQVFKELCEPAKIYAGFRKNEIVAGGAAVAVSPGGDAATGGAESSGDAAAGGAIGVGIAGDSAVNDALTPEAGDAGAGPAPDPYLLWLIVPSPDGRYAAVEFAEADSATFVYKTGGDFDAFARMLNRSLEAIDFKREVIRLSDEELRKPENADYYMASKRTAALRFIRSMFVDRVIHSSADAWKSKLTGLWSGV